MVKMPSKEEMSRRRVDGVIIAYMNGKKNENWAVGCIRTSGVSREDLKKIFQLVGMDTRPGTKSLQGLKERCQREELL